MRGVRSHVTIAIDYAMPAEAPTRWLGVLLGPLYARWCVRQMTQDLVHQFSRAGAMRPAMDSDRSRQ